MRVVLSSISPEHADSVARALVERRLAACVNLLPIRSVYRWDGAVQNDPETTLVMKVSEAGLDTMVRELRKLHPYDLPEIVVLAVDVGRSLPEYVDWVRAETGSRSAETEG
jgi:periplasmic divalent cation tolerance protein